MLVSDIMSDVSITMNEKELEFVYNMLNNIQVNGVEVIQLMADLSRKIEVHYTPETPESQD
jgi:hypothetical protein